MHPPSPLLSLAILSTLCKPLYAANATSGKETTPSIAPARAAITIPGAYDKGITLYEVTVRNISESNRTPYFTFKWLDELAETGPDNKILNAGNGSDSGDLKVSNFTTKGGSYSFELPSFGEFKQAASHLPWYRYRFSKKDATNGFGIVISHVIKVNGGPPIFRNASFTLPALSKWTVKNQTVNQKFSGSDLRGPITLDGHYNITPQLSYAPVGTEADNYTIDPNNTFPTYDRVEDHKGRPQDSTG